MDDNILYQFLDGVRSKSWSSILFGCIRLMNLSFGSYFKPLSGDNAFYNSSCYARKLSPFVIWASFLVGILSKLFTKNLFWQNWKGCLAERSSSGDFMF